MFYFTYFEQIVSLCAIIYSNTQKGSLFALILENFTRSQKYFTRSWQSRRLLPCQSSPSFPDKALVKGHLRIVTLRISMYYCEECNSLAMVLCWKIQKIISNVLKSPKSHVLILKIANVKSQQFANGPFLFPLLLEILACLTLPYPRQGKHQNYCWEIELRRK